MTVVKRPTNEIQVESESLTDHPLVKAVRAAFSKPTPDCYNRFRPSKPGFLAILVGQPNIERALSIFNLLIRKLEARGNSVIVRLGRRRTSTYVVISDLHIRVAIEEPVGKAKFDHEPSGRLTFVIYPYSDRPNRAKWDLGKRGVAEKQIDVVIAELVAIAERKEKLRPKREREVEQIKLEQECILKLEREKRQYEKRVRDLHEKASQWRRMQDAIGFFSYVEQFMQGLEPDDEMKPKLKEWIEFARECLRTTEPLLPVIGEGD